MTFDQAPLRRAAAFLAKRDPEKLRYAVAGFSDREVAGLPFLFEFWALPHQLPPEGNWRTWVILGGRGAGKTRAGSEWIRSQVEGPRPRDPGRAKRVALLAETIDQAREVMVFGDSGVMACSPPDRRPEWIASRKMLLWPNGATAQLFSAHEPESLRGPQFDCAWADELAKWKRGEEAWDMLQFGMRLGDDPRCCVTTTPRNAPVLTNLLAQSSTVKTHAPTSANRANLAKGFMEEVQRRYEGTRLGRQELEGVLLQDAEGALWTTRMIEAAQVDDPPYLDRIVVAVDPAVSSHKDSDACGIVVVGATTKGPPADWRAWVLEDATVQAASPLEWAKAALDARKRHGADRVLAEVNQGGSLVETVLRQVDPLVPFKAMRASQGKALRAEPVAALYEQGKVRHLRGLGALEDQMCLMTAQGFRGRGSPDRVDALVWALHELLIEGAGSWQEPRMRHL
jgi:phage terminase large subunit-like protein